MVDVLKLVDYFDNGLELVNAAEAGKDRRKIARSTPIHVGPAK